MKDTVAKSCRHSFPSLPILNYQYGFTLLEVLIVVVIIGILVAAVAPNFKGFYTQTVQEDATRMIATSLRTAQSMAVLHRAQMKVQFDLEKNKYQVIPEEFITKEWKTLPKYARPHSLPEGMKFVTLEFNTADKDDETSKIKTLNFYANGASDGGKIIISGSKLDKPMEIQIKKTTGNVIVNLEGTSEDTTSQEDEENAPSEY